MTLALVELLQRLRDNDEGVEIEVKRGTDVGSSALETVSAFSNEPGRNGGHLLFGVDEDERGLFGRMYRVVGVNDPEKLQRDLASACGTVFNVAIRPEIHVETDPSTRARVVIAYIPEADPAMKPIFIAARGLPGGAYRRIASTDQKCTDDDLRVLYGERGIRSIDQSIAHGTTFADLDHNALDLYRRYRGASRADAPELAYSDEELALALFAADRDEKGRIVPTIGGLVCFGTRAALRRHVPSWRIDYIRIPGTEWVQDPEHRFEAVIEIREPLLVAIPAALTAVADALPRTFRLPEGSARREENGGVPARALREAIVNSVMHRSYRTKEPVQILHYSNRLEIRNPGVSLVPDERLGEPGSHTRNDKIAAILRETRFAEEKGSGIRTMRVEMERAGLLPPILESDRVRDKFVATFLFHHFLDDRLVAWLAQFKGLQLTPDDARALVVVREAGAITNAVYRSFAHVDTLNASARLRVMRDKELLIQKGKGSGTYYVAGPRLASSITTAPVTDIGKPTSRPKARQLVVPHDLPEVLRVRAGQLGRRATREHMVNFILDCIAWRAMSTRELLAITGRSRTLIVRIMNELVREGLVAPTLPDSPYSPLQAYALTAAGKSRRERSS